MQIRPKDFFETRHGFAFAIVDFDLTQGRVPAYLRYQRDADGVWVKLDTAAAKTTLRVSAPNYLYRSPTVDAELHAVPINEVSRYHSADTRLAELLESTPADATLKSAARVARTLIDNGLPLSSLGVTGSLLLGAHTRHSDIDIVVYGRQVFAAARATVRRLCHSGEFGTLSRSHWFDAYGRRGCALDFSSYLFHEQRKGNKFLIGQRKVDLSMVPLAAERRADSGPYRKIGSTTLTARVRDDAYAFDLPACYVIDHPQIHEIWVFTATYIGQACTGETIEAAGLIEEDAAGIRRLIVGSDREAPGEYLKLIASDGA